LQGRWPNDPTILIFLLSCPRQRVLSKAVVDTLLAAYPDSARAHRPWCRNSFVLRQMPQAENEFRESSAAASRTQNCTSSLACDQVLRSGRNRRRVSAARPSLEPEMPRLLRWGTHCCNKAKPSRPDGTGAFQSSAVPDMPETLYSLGKAAALACDSAVAEKA